MKGPLGCFAAFTISSQSGPVNQSRLLPHCSRFPICQALHPTALQLCMCVSANQKPFVLWVAGKLLCTLQNASSLAPSLILLFFSFLLPVPVLAPTGQTGYSSLALLHTSLFCFLPEWRWHRDRHLGLGKDHRGYLVLEEWQITLGYKLSLFSYFRVMVYLISLS